MKRTVRIVLILLAVTALVLIKIFVIGSSNPGTPPTKSSGEQPPVSATVFVVSAGKVQDKLFTTGTLLANEEVDLKPETSGKIIHLYFKEGSRVQKGELLVKINDAALQAELKKLQVQLKLAEEKEGRQKQLLAAGGTSQEEYDASLGALNALRADMDMVKAQLDETEIRAPFNGTIGLKNVSEGSFVTNLTSIASIQQSDPVKIDLSLPEKYALVLHVGDSIRFTTEGANGKFTGVIYAIEPRIDQETRTLHLRAQCPNPHGALFPGSFVKIELELGNRGSSLMVPTESLVPELKGQKVWVVKMGKAESRKVETGLRTDAYIEIMSGLNAGDTVLTTGLMSVKSGAKVRVVPGN
jgi:membrane fusion protein (multidrug efflux system)